MPTARHAAELLSPWFMSLMYSARLPLSGGPPATSMIVSNGPLRLLLPSGVAMKAGIRLRPIWG
jgi:hypothetical protein